MNRAIGIDITSEQIERAKQFSTNATNLQFLTADTQALPFANNQFDLLINVESVHCYPNYKCFLNQVERVLKPGGHFIFADIILNSKRQDRQLFQYLKKNTSLVLIKQENVKRAIRHRLQAHEDAFISSLIKLYHNDVYAAMKDAPYIATAYGASFLWDSFFFKPNLKSKLLESELKKLLQTTDGNKVVSYKHFILKKT